jgi:hypothetical protein
MTTHEFAPDGRPEETPPDENSDFDPNLTEDYYPPDETVPFTPGNIEHPIGDNLGTTEEGTKADV